MVYARTVLRPITDGWKERKMTEKSGKVNESQIDFLKPCPFCNSQNLAKYRFNIGGFLDKDGCIETICENGDTFRIECDCGCKFDKHQDDLYTRLERAYGYDIEFTDDDLWNRLIADWNGRV